MADKAPSAAEQQLLAALGELTESTSFCVSGAYPLVLPGLTVEGMGEVSLPVVESNAQELITHARQAPYGRGEATIVDTDVRRVWQLEPDQFQLKNSKWSVVVDEITQAVRSELGIKQKVTASLYKLLVYEQGSFFAPHRDTEKTHRMFATLVICLPSKHEGGELIVSHAGQSKVVDFGGKGASYDLHYAAFYADCQHEVRPVTEGYRVCLVYNLATEDQNEPPTAPEISAPIQSATTAVEAIFAEDDSRQMIIVPLLHQYTEAGLSPDTSVDASEDQQVDETAEKPLAFKGADRARTAILAQVAARTRCRAYVALLTHWQTGYPDYSTVEYEPYNGRWGRGYERTVQQNEGAQFEEIFDEATSLKHWHTLDGKRQAFAEWTFDLDDIVSDVPAHNRPYRQSVHEATGNEGMSMDRWYHQAVVVLWPESRHFHVLASQGAENSVPALHELVTTSADPVQCADCRSFATHIINAWNSSTGARRGQSESLGTSLMRSLVAIGDRHLARSFFEQVLPREYYTLDAPLLVAVAELAGWKSIEKPLVTFFRGHTPTHYSADLPSVMAIFGALATFGDRFSSTRKQVCKSLLNEVLEMVARWETARPTRNGLQGVVEPLMRGIASVGTRKHLDHLMAQIAANPKHYDLHRVVIPPLRNLTGDEKFGGMGKLAGAAVSVLRQFCIHQLTERTAEEPQPPKNWRREVTFDCACADCQELARFLRDKDAKVHQFPRRTDLRQHLQRQIEHHPTDCTCITIERGRPYTLVCTKNQASYERALAQYQTDCELLTELSNG